MPKNTLALFKSASVFLRLLAGPGFLFGCGNFSTDNADQSAPIQAKAEEASCSHIRAVTGGISITGTGLYYYRPTSLTTGLTGDPVAGKIAFAEIAVKDASNTVIQCGSTDEQGNFSVDIPRTVGAYTLFINSRADNAKLHVSVLKDITTNEYYSLTQAFSISSSEGAAKNIGILSAMARLSEDGELKGGAFNIMKNIHRANSYIRNTIGDSAWVAPKVAVYWKAGFNPNSYRSPDLANSGLSYYSTGNRKLYILGGISGQVNAATVDTDHFDDSVIIHEYGHFLEDVYAKQDSPGGSHTGNGMIDPRLAWSEGWANFFQSAVLTNWNESTGTYGADANVARGKYYIDTLGFTGDSIESGESGKVSISFDLTRAGGSATGQDLVNSDGEGTFREISISRVLYKTISTSVTVSPRAALPFSALWTSFSNVDAGMASDGAHFRNVGLFNSYLNSVITNSYPGNAANWASVLSDEKQNSSTIDYGNPLVANAGSCSISSKTILPLNDIGICSPIQGVSSTSNKLRTNDFYSYYHDGGSASVTLNYAASSGKVISDLDLWVYQDEHEIFEDCYEQLGYQFADFGVVARSVRRLGSGESGSEFVSLTGLPAGYYLINVRAYSLNQTNMPTKGSTYSFQVTTGATTRNLCPAN